MKNNIWIDRENNRGCYTDTVNDCYLSYQPNIDSADPDRFSDLDSANPETAIVLLNDKTKSSGKRLLIYRGDWRKELQEIFPDVEKLKEHYRQHGGHFFSDGLEEDIN